MYIWVCACMCISGSVLLLSAYTENYGSIIIKVLIPLISMKTVCANLKLSCLLKLVL